MVRSFAPDTAERRRLAHTQFKGREWKSDESMEEYSQALEKLLEKALPDANEETRRAELLMSRFTEGMPAEIAYQLSLQTLQTFEEVLMRAQELELLQSRLKGRRTVGAVGRSADPHEEEMKMLRRRIAELEAGEARGETGNVGSGGRQQVEQLPVRQQGAYEEKAMFSL
eukprot:m.259037 g.259037  ORF g.259037 m.259037 type:complete len:170 (+) comp40415_c0_seq2:558-1067(+)